MEYFSPHFFLPPISLSLSPWFCLLHLWFDGFFPGAHWYELNGGMQDFNYIRSDCFDVTLELSCCKYPNATELPVEWAKNKRSLIEYMKMTHAGIKGLITDHNGYPIQDMEVFVEGLQTKPVRTTERGEFWRLLLPGRLHTRGNDPFVNIYIITTYFEYLRDIQIVIRYLLEYSRIHRIFRKIFNIVRNIYKIFYYILFCYFPLRYIQRSSHRFWVRQFVIMKCVCERKISNNLFIVFSFNWKLWTKRNPASNCRCQSTVNREFQHDARTSCRRYLLKNNELLFWQEHLNLLLIHPNEILFSVWSFFFSFWFGSKICIYKAINLSH